MTTKAPPRRITSYTVSELREIADRAEEGRLEGFIVPPGAVDLYAEALRALARERQRG
ncbi:hypothetical protein [Methylobacterium segetis]|uniref:hypothetical protein n=1 Tax=Methylobacterium segetis TaxID=2488750 RepID=UPI0014048A70|nr:hypothetical protein [Methylobacterium segetis]